ncbi:MAG: sulfite exporter TauE/SafE family protein [Oscillospiraceae bacterium]
MKSLRFYLLGFFAGILNGFFGAGGGLLVVPMLEASELETKQSHATSIAIILPLSIMSTIMYIINGVKIDISILSITIPLGLLGAILGSFLLTKIKSTWLKKIFGVIMIISAVRILLR